MKKAIIILLAILIFISLISAASVAYFYNKQSSKDTIQVPQSKSSSQTPSPAASSTLAKQGTITGSLGYPSEFIPPGRVKAQNTNTKQVFTVNVEGLQENIGTDKFSIEVPEGTYYLKYEACTEPKEPDNCIDGYYTSNDGTAQNQTHDLIPVKIKRGETVGNIHILDFYGLPSTDPGF